MAAARLWTTVFLLHAAFILLSVASTETRCYWCGPLAEQVHRSRRSAPCGASDPVTVCEPGYNYCAVVATSPPRVESRYCVKVYQDECYPLYCNSTKTWKMTCPCRGDLCNGPNTDRENEAFALLPKLVAKTHNARINKRTANASPHLIKHEGKKRIISTGDVEIHNISNVRSNEVNNVTEDNKLIVTENDAENMQSDQPVNIIVEHHSEDDAQSTVATIDNEQKSTVVSNQLIEIEIHVSDPTEKSNTMKGGEQPCTDLPTTGESSKARKHTEPIKDEEISIATTIKSVVETEAAMKTTGNVNAVESETMKPTETVQQAAVESISTDKPHVESPGSTTTGSTTIELMPNDQPMNPVDQMQNDAPLISPTDTIHIKTSEVIKVEEPPTKDTMKESSGIPTAEALQQNGSPTVSAALVPITEKPTEPTTTEATTVPTILTTREPIALKTTTPAPQSKNNSVRITFSYTLILLVCAVHL